MLLSPSTLPSPRNPGSVVASSALVVSLVICSKKPALTSLFRAPLPSAFCCPSDCSYPCHLLESCVPFSHLYNDLFSRLLPARDRAMTARALLLSMGSCPESSEEGTGPASRDKPAMRARGGRVCYTSCTPRGHLRMFLVFPSLSKQGN